MNKINIWSNNKKYVRVNVCMYVCVWLSVCLCVCMCVMYKCMCVHIYICVCMRVCVCLCEWLCVWWGRQKEKQGKPNKNHSTYPFAPAVCTTTDRGAVRGSARPQDGGSWPAAVLAVGEALGLLDKTTSLKGERERDSHTINVCMKDSNRRK